MQLNREEAQVFLNMIGTNVTDSSMSVLDKIENSFPDLVRNTTYAPILRDWRSNREKQKKSAMAEISKQLANVRGSLAECERIAKSAGIGFVLDVADVELEFTAKDGWSSSYC
jgi:hypothetical protein